MCCVGGSRCAPSFTAFKDSQGSVSAFSKHSSSTINLHLSGNQSALLIREESEQTPLCLPSISGHNKDRLACAARPDEWPTMDFTAVEMIGFYAL